MGLFKSKKEKLSRLEEKLIKKGKSPHKIKQRLETRSKLQDVGKGIGGMVAGASSTFISGMPLAGLAGKVLSKVPVIVEKLPIVKEVAAVGAIQFDAKVIEYGGIPQAILADLMPVIDEIRNGEYLEAVLTLAIFASAGVAYLLI